MLKELRPHKDNRQILTRNLTPLLPVTIPSCFKLGAVWPTISMKILTIADDPAVAQALQLLSTDYNYAVDIALDGEAGLQLAETFDYDLILLDEILPKLDKIRLYQVLRAKKSQSSILLLTRQEKGHQKAILPKRGCVNAPNARSHDCVVKPFDTEELIARVQALLQGSRSTNPSVLTWGRLSLDPSRRKVTYDSQLLPVTPKEYAILELFLRSPQQALSPPAILDQVWTSLEAPGEKAVRVYIKELRQKLTTVGAPKDFIKTRRRLGYHLNSLYSSSLVPQMVDALTAPQLAELDAAKKELQTTVEQLRSTQVALQQKNQELEIAHQIIEQDQQQLKALREELELQVVERCTKAALRESEDKYCTLFNSIDEGLILCDVIFDENGCPIDIFYVEANAAATRMTGQELKGRRISDLSPNFEPEWLEIWGRVARTGEAVRMELPAAPLNTWYEFHVFKPDAANNQRVVVIYKDISDRKQAELELRESREQFRVLSDISPVGIFRNDLQGICTYANAKTLEITGLSLEQNLGDGWGKYLHPDDRDWMYAAWLDFVAQTKLGHHPTYQVEHRYLYEDGSLKWVFAQAVPEYNAQGRLVGFVGSVVDISERKQLEMKLQALNLAKDDFLSMVSHELRTPLASIKLTSELLELALGQYLSNLSNPVEELSMEGRTGNVTTLINRVPRYLSILKAECSRELSLVNNLLELQHLELGEVTPIWGEMNLSQWLPAIVSSYQERAVDRSLTLHLQMPGSLPSLVSDEEKLTSIVRELLTNACKYAPPGGVITVEVTQMSERLQLSVSNTGQAIPPDALPHLFDKFYRIPGRDRWKQGGTGLGLTLVKQQVESLGGCIQVGSDAERTVFTVELPTSL